MVTILIDVENKDPFNADDWEFFNYSLPDHRIAQRPVWYQQGESKRASSRLLCLSSIGISDRIFSQILEVLNPGDLLVFNNTSVIPSRFFAKTQSGASVELLLCIPSIEKTVPGISRNDSGPFKFWTALARPMRRLSEGDELRISENLSAKILGRDKSERFLEVELVVKTLAGVNKENPMGVDFLALMHEAGGVPIPPYIRNGKSDIDDIDDYQTVYAEVEGSVAAPTAGLHFSNDILASLSANQINTAFITLHVGPASFLPVSNENARPPAERLHVSSDVWKAISQTKAKGGRVIAVGTTVVRSLEATYLALERAAGSETTNILNIWFETNLFIAPGFKFNVVDACFTNFHQPRSTHLMLIAAFIGKKRLEEVYRHALSSGYRFLSYGDSSFLELK